jgi:poly(A) polymerase
VAYGRSLEADLARRDFTVNAIAARLPSLEIVDPFGGMGDLKAKVLRTPGRPEDSFRDDALRMLRAARFAAQLGFTVVPEVQAAMTAMAGRLSVVSAERIAAELAKLICSPGPGGRSGESRCSSAPGWRSRSCRRSPGCGWRRTSMSGTRTSTSTP